MYYCAQIAADVAATYCQPTPVENPVNNQDTITALKIRRDLTGESFNDGTIDAWTEALDPWTPSQVRTAMITAAKTHHRVTVAQVVELLPTPVTPAPLTPPLHCEACDDTGWVDNPHHHSRLCTDHTTCHCHGVTPCRCSRGQAMIETQRRILAHNNKPT
jgi:hypothetical protein